MEWIVDQAFAAAVALSAEAIVKYASSAAALVVRKDDLSAWLTHAIGQFSEELSESEFTDLHLRLRDPDVWQYLADPGPERLVRALEPCFSVTRGADACEAGALFVARQLFETTLGFSGSPIWARVMFARMTRDIAALSQQVQSGLGAQAALIAASPKLKFGLEDIGTTVLAKLVELLDRMDSTKATTADVVAYLEARLRDWDMPEWRAIPRPPSQLERSLLVREAKRTPTNYQRALEGTQMLVILGGPGSGKTWLARRCARDSGQEALFALSRGGSLDEVELPLFATWAALQRTSNLDVRSAVVSAAFALEVGHGDVVGPRVHQRLRAFFIDRVHPTLLVLDSLDEAGLVGGVRNPVPRVATIGWRVVVTSRHGAWQELYSPAQYSVGDVRPRVADLQDLEYPAQVEGFVRAWFSDSPEHGNALIRQIRDRPDLRRSAGVPLLLTFYCLIASEGPLPNLRRELYRRVVRRLLSKDWRSLDAGNPKRLNPALEQTLRHWAWTAAKSDAYSGLGSWEDDFVGSLPPSELAEGDVERLDCVAAKTSASNWDDETSRRRFVHRTVLEHLVGQVVAEMDESQATQALLPHIWFDTDWLVALPTALVSHPAREEILESLLSQAEGGSPDTAQAWADAEVARLVLDVAAQSSPQEWSARWRDRINDYRVQAAGSAITALTLPNLGPNPTHGQADTLPQQIIDSLRGSRQWTDSNARIRPNVLSAISQLSAPSALVSLVDMLSSLGPTPEERAQARSQMIQVLVRQWSWSTVGVRVEIPESPVRGPALECLLRLDPTAEGQAALRESLEAAARSRDPQNAVWALSRMGYTHAERAASFDVIARIIVQSDERRARRIIEIVLGTGSTMDHESLCDALNRTIQGPIRAGIAYVLRLISDLRPPESSAAAVRRTIVSLLPACDPSTAADVSRVLLDLDPRFLELVKAREALEDARARSTPMEVDYITKAINALDSFHLPARTHRQNGGEVIDREEHDALLAALAHVRPEDVPGIVDGLLAVCLIPPDVDRVIWDLTYSLRVVDPGRACYLAGRLKMLGLSQDESDAIRESLRGMLPGARPEEVPPLVDKLIELDETADHAATRAALVRTMSEVDPGRACYLADQLKLLGLSRDESDAIRESLRGMLPGARPEEVPPLVDKLIELDETADHAATRAALVRTMSEVDPGRAGYLAGRLAQLAGRLARLGLPREESADVRESLLGLLPSAPPEQVPPLIDSLIELDDAGDHSSTRADLVRVLNKLPPHRRPTVARSISALSPTPQEAAAIRSTIVGSLYSIDDSTALVDFLLDLDPGPDHADARAELIASLPGLTPAVMLRVARRLADTNPTFGESQSACAALCGVVTTVEERLIPDLVKIITVLDPSQDHATSRDCLISKLDQLTPSRLIAVVRCVLDDHTSPGQKAEIRIALAHALVVGQYPPDAASIAKLLTQCDPDVAESVSAADVLVEILRRSRKVEAIIEVARALGGLGDLPESILASARAELLSVLSKSRSRESLQVVQALRSLRPDPDALRLMRGKLLSDVIPFATYDIRSQLDLLVELDPSNRKDDSRIELIGSLQNLPPDQALVVGQRALDLQPSRSQAAEAVHKILDLIPKAEWSDAEKLVDLLWGFAGSYDSEVAKQGIVNLLASLSDQVASHLIPRIARLPLTMHQMATVRGSAIGILDGYSATPEDASLVQALVSLGPGKQELDHVRGPIIDTILNRIRSGEEIQSAVQDAAALFPTQAERDAVAAEILEITPATVTKRRSYLESVLGAWKLMNPSPSALEALRVALVTAIPKVGSDDLDTHCELILRYDSSKENEATRRDLVQALPTVSSSRSTILAAKIHAMHPTGAESRQVLKSLLEKLQISEASDLLEISRSALLFDISGDAVWAAIANKIPALRPGAAAESALELAKLGPPVTHAAEMRGALCGMITNSNSRLSDVWRLIAALLALDTDGGHSNARSELVGTLPRVDPERALLIATQVTKLQPTAQQSSELCKAIAQGLPGAHHRDVRNLVDLMIDLDPTQGQQAARSLLLGTLDSLGPREAEIVVKSLINMGLNSAEMMVVWECSVRRLQNASEADLPAIVDLLVQLDLEVSGGPGAARRELISVLDQLDSSKSRLHVVTKIASLRPTPDETPVLRSVLEEELRHCTPDNALTLANLLASLGPSPQEARVALQAVLPLLAEAGAEYRAPATAVSRMLVHLQLPDEELEVARRLLRSAILKVDGERAPELVEALNILTPAEEYLVSLREELAARLRSASLEELSSLVDRLVQLEGDTAGAATCEDIVRCLPHVHGERAALLAMRAYSFDPDPAQSAVIAAALVPTLDRATTEVAEARVYALTQLGSNEMKARARELLFDRARADTDQLPQILGWLLLLEPTITELSMAAEELRLALPAISSSAGLTEAIRTLRRLSTVTEWLDWIRCAPQTLLDSH